ncbi:uncharacterized protein MONOS_16298 [Monocercomonoides exilis]|uniref:uncharacterized protein n=1 Tax=Monocercomonoides exilis TaxID=2049356 RepID=UPI00355A95B4|nr:hypothetical protein MONOS_16298 [Monocercomonoides exilis]|eukprot:MONOS_16298.1-p1 / transcript=MONOS_16298.1 / gene=MONOS_16298 / organism=Monocercomonoides_exilis_PA203 / gene_product=unspecified product / transcript_product=unspecified product / location=Mono_scaffold01626:2474-4229(-) / protein_length=444 / sequence_SO=supercontig / SO=protein_coding / is_pseudo=false
MHFLEQIPICEVNAPMQSIVLRNEGGTSIDNRLELSDVKRLNASATYFPLFECSITRGIVPAMKTLLAGDGFIAKEGAEPLVDEKKTTIPAPLSPLPGQLCLLSHERIGFGSVAGGSIERRLVCLVYPRVRRHRALQKRAYEKRKKRDILHNWKEIHPLIKLQNTSTLFAVNNEEASSKVIQIFLYQCFPSTCRTSFMNASSSSSLSNVVASNINSGKTYDHSVIASLSTQHSQLGKIKGFPSSSYPVPSQSSSSSSLAIAPHQPSIRKQPPRVSVIERMTKSRGIQIATRLEQFRPVLEKARNEENYGIPLNETTKQALEIAAQTKEEQKIRNFQKEKERKAFGMYNLTPTSSAMKGTPREDKRNLDPLRESQSSSVGGRRMTFAEEVSGVNVSLPPLLNPSSGSSSGSCSVSVPLSSQQGIVRQWFMQSQEIQGIQWFIST